MKGGPWVFAWSAAAVLLAGGGIVYRNYKQRGIRNNNPGNLTITSIAWKGKVPIERNKDGRFEQFEDFQGIPGHIWGLRAMFMDLRGDVQKRGLTTVRKLISSYAPPSENDTTAYIAAVAAKLKKSPDAALAPADLLPLQAAIIEHENGIQPYPLADLQRAAAIA